MGSFQSNLKLRPVRENMDETINEAPNESHDHSKYYDVPRSKKTDAGEKGEIVISNMKSHSK
jgi:hypothetical protein